MSTRPTKTASTKRVKFIYQTRLAGGKIAHVGELMDVSASVADELLGSGKIEEVQEVEAEPAVESESKAREERGKIR